MCMFDPFDLLDLLRDPRRDLHEDHAVWLAVLRKAYLRDPQDKGGVLGLLHGFRCCGAQLVRRPKGGYMLQPRFTEAGGAWVDKAAWEKDRDEFLVPQADVLRGILQD